MLLGSLQLLLSMHGPWPQAPEAAWDHYRAQFSRSFLLGPKKHLSISIYGDIPASLQKGFVWDIPILMFLLMCFFGAIWGFPEFGGGGRV